MIDDNPLKQGKYTPGSNVPIVSIDILKDIKNGILFIPLAWNFYTEIKSRIKAKRDNPNDLFIKYEEKKQNKEDCLDIINELSELYEEHEEFKRWIKKEAKRRHKIAVMEYLNNPVY